MASHKPQEDMDEIPQDEDALIDLDEAGEEIVDDSDHPMDSDGEDHEHILQEEEEEEDQEIQLQNDSKFHFDLHKDSIFCIAQHPRDPSIIATGSGDHTTYVFSADPPPPLLPPSYESNPSPGRPSLSSLAKLSGHSDSINAITFTLPDGAYLITGGLDGRLRVHNTSDQNYPLVAEAQEVPEINFLAPCPHPDHPNTFALGASDNSVWVYTIDASDATTPLQVVQAFFLHTESSTAGAWTPDGKLLATVSEDGSLYVWDVFGEAAAAGVTSAQSQAVVGITAEDQRFATEGLYSVAIAPTGAFVVVGGAGGMIRVVGLPRLGATSTSTSQGLKGGGSKNKSGGGGGGAGGKKRTNGPESPASASQTGQILASLQTQSDSIETLSFSHPPLTLLAAGSVDGSIALFDVAHRFAVRRHIRAAHDEYAVVQVAFVHDPHHHGSGPSQSRHHLLTSCGLDGVVRSWDVRGGTVVAGAGDRGFVGEWRGHQGGGEGGGVLGFVQGGGRIVTAGDDGVSLVFSVEG